METTKVRWSVQDIVEGQASNYTLSNGVETVTHMTRHPGLSMAQVWDVATAHCRQLNAALGLKRISVREVAAKALAQG